MREIIISGNLTVLQEEIARLKKQSELDFSKALNQIDSEKKTLLHIAAQHGHFEIVKELLLLGLDPKAKDGNGNTPLDLAIHTKHSAMIALLRTRIAWQDHQAKNFSMSTVLGYLEDAHNKIKAARNKNLVLVIGNTGAGKSTLLNYLLGARYKIKKVRRDFFVELVSGIEQARVGNSATISETLYPQVFASQGEDYILCDLAGFADTRSKEKAICAASSTQMLTKQAKQIKSILLTLSFDDLKGQRAAAFKKVCKTLYHVLQGNYELLSKSIYFVFTKAEGYSVEEIIKNYIDELLDHPKEGLLVKQNANLLSEEDEGLLNILLAMRNNQHRILISNIADQGESAKQLLEKIKESQPQPVSTLDFTNHDDNQIYFNSMLVKLANEYLERVRILENELPKALLLENNKFHNQVQKINYFHCEIQNLEAQKEIVFNSDYLEAKIKTMSDLVSNNKKELIELEKIITSKIVEREHWTTHMQTLKDNHFFVRVIRNNIQMAIDLINRYISDLRAKTAQLNKANIELESEIEDCRDEIRQGYTEFKKRDLSIDAEILQLQKSIADAETIQKEIFEKIQNIAQKKLDVLMELKVNKSIFNIAYDSIKVLNLKDAKALQFIASYKDDFDQQISNNNNSFKHSLFFHQSL